MTEREIESHYNADGIDPFTVLPMLYKLNNIDEPYIGFLYGNVLKYVWRMGAKGNPVSDIDKAIVYLNTLKAEIQKH